MAFELVGPLAVSAATAALVSWLAVRTLVVWPDTPPGEETRQRPACGVCGEVLQNRRAAADHMDELHGMRLTGESLDSVLDAPPRGDEQ